MEVQEAAEEEINPYRKESCKILPILNFRQGLTKLLQPVTVEGEMKQKCPAELNSRVIRINLGDYALLREISRRAGVTFAEALHLALERQEVECLTTKIKSSSKSWPESSSSGTCASGEAQ